jgi:hypothetical protein
MSLRSTPTSVGLQLSVRPVRVEANPVGSETIYSITVPACRYGLAVYCPRARFACGGSVLQISAEETVVSGASTQTVFDCEYRLLGIEQLLVSVRITPGALRAMTPRQLTRALQPPLRDVREAVLLGLGQ